MNTYNVMTQGRVTTPPHKKKEEEKNCPPLQILIFFFFFGGGVFLIFEVVFILWGFFIHSFIPAVGVAVGRHSCGRLAMMLVATISVIIFFPFLA